MVGFGGHIIGGGELGCALIMDHVQLKSIGGERVQT
jgi:hypothetical protein